MFKKALFSFIVLLSVTFQSVYANENFAEMKAQAKLSDDTYQPANTLAALLTKQGQTLVHQSLMVDSQVSYFLSEANGVQTIAVRGTDNLENAIIDLSLSLKDDPILDIKLHQGFAAAARAVYKDMQPYLKKDEPIHITGHSLGGAIAVILGMYLKHDGDNITQIITFGQPKVTNVTGAKAFADLPLIRVVDENDIVPLVPPISPLQIKDLDIFWHMGEEVILLGDKQYSVTSGIKSALRATKFTSSIPNEKNLDAHKMTTYLTNIEGLQKDPVDVPYKMDINLFGISID